MGRDLPAYPTLFAKFADTLIGANDDIVQPAETDALDWEVELAVVIGTPVRRATEDAGGGRHRRLHGAQRRHLPRLAVPHPRVAAGQDLGAPRTPVGPYLVTPDELPGGVRPALRSHAPRSTARSMQQDNTGRPALRPGRPGRSTSRPWSPSTPATSSPPARRAASATPASRPSTCIGGQTVVTEIDGIGRLREHGRGGRMT